MTDPDINKLIDNRSRELWNIVKKQKNISLKFHSDRNYMCFTLGSNTTIYISENNYNTNWFAHELLHIYLDTKKINVDGYIKARIRENTLLKSILSELLVEHISNTLEHSKMLHIYLGLGFDRTQFIMDYDERKCTDGEIDVISRSINDSSLWKLSIDLFIGKFFAIKSCPNNKIDYTLHLIQLQNLDTSLFEILQTFWNSWQAYDIDKSDIIANNYWDFCDSFYDSLIEWAKNKAPE